MATLNARFTLRTFGDRNDERDIILKPGETVILGRASKSIHDVSLQPSLTNARFNCPVVSRKHAVIDFDGTSIAIADCGSLHGTAVNGKELVALDKMELHHGDVIRLGTEVQRGEETHQALFMEFQRLSDFADLKPGTHEAGAYAYSSDVDDDDDAGSDSSEIAQASSSAYTTPEQIKAVPGSQSRPIDLDVNEQPFTSTADDAVVFIKKPLTSRFLLEEVWSQDVEDDELLSDDHNDLASVEELSEVNMISDSEDDDESEPHQDSEPQQEREPSPECNNAAEAPLNTHVAQKLQETMYVTSSQDAAKEPLANHAPSRSRYDPVRNSQIEEPSWSAAPDYTACSWQAENAYYFNPPVTDAAPSALPYSLPMDYYTCSLMPDSSSSNTNVSPPKPSEMKTRISITDIVDNTTQVEESLEIPTEASNPGLTDTPINSNKRKASEITGGAVQAESVAKKVVLAQDSAANRVIVRLPLLSVRRNRSSRQKVVKKFAASATHMAAGAVLGMVGTVAFLSSSYADQLIQWLS